MATKDRPGTDRASVAGLRLRTGLKAGLNPQPIPPGRESMMQFAQTAPLFQAGGLSRGPGCPGPMLRG